MAREGKTKFEAYIDNIIAKPFKEVLYKENLSFTKWLEEEQKKYTNKKKYIKKKWKSFKKVLTFVMTRVII